MRQLGSWDLPMPVGVCTFEKAPVGQAARVKFPLLVLGITVGLGAAGCGRSGAPGLLPRQDSADTKSSQKEQLRIALQQRGFREDTVEVDDQAPGEPVTKVVLSDYMVKDDDLAMLSGLDRLETLDLWGTQVSGPGLAHLGPCRHLRELRLSGHLGDAGLQYLRSLTGLHKLDVSADAKITGRGLQHLRGLAELQELRLSVCPLADEDLQPLQHLTSLKILHVGSTRIQGPGLQYLKGLSQLEVLDISGTEVTDESLAALHGLGNLRELDLGFTAVRRPGLDQLKGLPKLEELTLAGDKVSDTTLAHLRGRTGLQVLRLPDTSVTDAGLAHLEGLTRLRVLLLDTGPAPGRITDVGLEHLKGLTALEALNLNWCPVRGTGLKHLRGLSNLQLLYLFQSRVGDEGLAFLRGMSRLERLDLGGTQVSGAGLRHLSALANLRGLNLSGTQVDDDSLKYLSSLTNLDYLQLGATRITDAGLEHLQGLTNLREIQCGPRVTDRGAARLRKALPKAHILHPPDKGTNKGVGSLSSANPAWFIWAPGRAKSLVPGPASSIMSAKARLALKLPTPLISPPTFGAGPICLPGACPASCGA